MSEFSISSPDFEEGGEIPKKFGYKHGNASPVLKILKPAEARSIALIMDDPDAMGPAGKVWVHWVMYDIDSFSRFNNLHNVTIPFTGDPVTKPLTLKSWNATANASAKVYQEALKASNEIIKASQNSRHGENHVGAKVGVNDFGEFDYGGPAPPDKRHTYIFKAYALDIAHLELPQFDHPGTKKDVEVAMKGHIIAEAKLTGTFAP